MYHPVRKKMSNILTNTLILITIIHPQSTLTKFVETTETNHDTDDSFDNNIIDFEEDISLKLNKKYGILPWNDSGYNKDALRYTIVSEAKSKNEDDTKLSNKDKKLNINLKNQTNDVININTVKEIVHKNYTNITNTTKTIDSDDKIKDETTTQDYSVYTRIPLELLSTTQNILISIIESTTEPDLTVIPLSTTVKIPKIDISETVTLPTSTQNTDISTTDGVEPVSKSTVSIETTEVTESNASTTSSAETESTTTIEANESTTNHIDSETVKKQNVITRDVSTTDNDIQTSTEHSTERNETNINRSEDSTEFDKDVPLYTELDTDGEIEIPEDYYDAKDVIPTTAPKNDALSVIFGLAGTVVESVVESVAERVVPKGIFDLFKRMQRQSEALEAERLRSREENGGIGHFTRGILKSISSGISRPLSQLMAGVRDIGSLDTDRGFINSLASGVTSVADVANSVVDVFKDRVQAIYPGTVWCGDGRSAAARSGDLGLFFFTDTCCRQHDACKLFILAGETKYGLTNTGLFTRSHCSCDSKFRECLRRTNSLVSAQIGLTYFNVLGPQCFRRAHPIVKCVRRTRITGQKCEEYELDYTKPRMWQWFDNETF